MKSVPQSSILFTQIEDEFLSLLSDLRSEVPSWIWVKKQPIVFFFNIYSV
jgi:hypothetical protein